ncbi:MAG: hypothetical protein RLZZ490_2316 [Cyanobacteriota bacterium]|jgi:hypothetical protein
MLFPKILTLWVIWAGKLPSVKFLQGVEDDNGSLL